MIELMKDSLKTLISFIKIKNNINQYWNSLYTESIKSIFWSDCILEEGPEIPVNKCQGE